MEYQSEKYGFNINKDKFLNIYKKFYFFSKNFKLKFILDIDVIDEKPNKEINNLPNFNDNQRPNNIQRKNRTLQYYKFLFYSMKLEIKNVELINLIRSSNISEILLWVLSMMIILEYNTLFVILHILHAIRGILGLFLLIKIPQSYEIVQGMESEKYREDLENKIFNDFTRKIINIEVIEKSKQLKNLSILYVIITLINIFVDLIDYLNSLSKFNHVEDDNDQKISLLVNFVIAILYLGKLFF